MRAPALALVYGPFTERISNYRSQSGVRFLRICKPNQGLSIVPLPDMPEPKWNVHESVRGNGVIYIFLHHTMSQGGLTAAYC
jgi:hypothetical protein